MKNFKIQKVGSVKWTFIDSILESSIVNSYTAFTLSYYDALTWKIDTTLIVWLMFLRDHILEISVLKGRQLYFNF